jgi:hypothetical protein
MNISSHQTFPLRRMRPFPGVKLRISWRNDTRGNPQNGVERSHRIEPTIKTKHVLIEVGLQMFWFNAPMMRSLDPSFQVAENKVDHGQVCFCLVRVAAENQCLMPVSHLRKSLIPDPSIGANDGVRCNVIFNEARKHFGAPIWHDAKPQTTGIDAARARLAVILTRPNFDGADYGSLVMCAASFSARLTADIAFVYFYRVIASDGVTLGANHARAEFVENLKGRLVAAKRELALELNGRLAGCLRGHKIRTPKPCREGRVTRLHDSASRERCVGLASTAAQYYRRACLEPIWFSDKSAFRTRKPIGPANRFKVGGTSHVIGEYPLKFWKRSRETAYVHVWEYRNSDRQCQATG